jgi:hypothetical protein
MATSGLTQQQVQELHRRYEELQERKAWKDQKDYSVALMRQMQDELEYYWKFQEWLRFVHPEVINEWRALEKIKGEE